MGHDPGLFYLLPDVWMSYLEFDWPFVGFSLPLAAPDQVFLHLTEVNTFSNFNVGMPVQLKYFLELFSMVSYTCRISSFVLFIFNIDKLIMSTIYSTMQQTLSKFNFLLSHVLLLTFFVRVYFSFHERGRLIDIISITYLKVKPTWPNFFGKLKSISS